MLDLLLHADDQLAASSADYGLIAYGILFAIIFAETGLVVTPFLPGDSLLFAAGALAATGALPARAAAAGARRSRRSLGDAVNYAVGRRVAHRFLDDAPRHRACIAGRQARARGSGRTSSSSKHGGKAVVLARFVPIVRTLRAVRRRRRRHAVPHVRALQRHRRGPVGGHLRRRRVSRSATSRS